MVFPSLVFPVAAQVDGPRLVIRGGPGRRPSTVAKGRQAARRGTDATQDQRHRRLYADLSPAFAFRLSFALSSGFFFFSLLPLSLLPLSPMSFSFGKQCAGPEHCAEAAPSGRSSKTLFDSIRILSSDWLDFLRRNRTTRRCTARLLLIVRRQRRPWPGQGGARKFGGLVSHVARGYRVLAE